MIFSFAVTFVLAKLLDATMGLRVSDEDEQQGLDLTQHAESAYNIGELGSMDRI